VCDVTSIDYDLENGSGGQEDKKVVLLYKGFVHGGRGESKKRRGKFVNFSQE